MKEMLNQLVATRFGTFAILLLAAFLEAYGDSCFQQGLYRSTGAARYAAFVGGGLTLAFYGLVVNTPPWDFGKLLGIYVRAVLSGRAVSRMGKISADADRADHGGWFTDRCWRCGNYALEAMTILRVS